MVCRMPGSSVLHCHCLPEFALIHVLWLVMQYNIYCPMTEDEMVGWHHRLDGHGFEQVLGVGDGQGSLACCSPGGSQRIGQDWATELHWAGVLPYYESSSAFGHDQTGSLGSWVDSNGQKAVLCERVSTGFFALPRLALCPTILRGLVRWKEGWEGWVTGLGNW